MGSGNTFYKWWRVLYPIFLQWLLSMMVTTAVIWFCRNLLVLDVRDQMDSFQLEEYWRSRYRGMALGITAATHIISFAVMAILYRGDRRQNPAYERSEVSAGWYVPLIQLGACGCFVANGLLNLSGLTRLLADGYETVQEVLYDSSTLWLSVFTVVIAAPLAEEFLFRGLCFRRMRETVPFAQSALASAILFGAYHGNLLQAIYGFLLGLLFAWSYERYRSLLAPVVLHMAANAFSLALSKMPQLNALLAGSVWRLVVSVLIFTLIGSGCFYLVQVRMHQKEKKT